MPDQKITIDVNIDPSTLSQIPKLKDSLDSLTESIANVNKQLFNYNKQGQETVNWGAKLKKGTVELFENFKTLKEGIIALSDSFEGWAGAVAGIFTLVTTFGPGIVDFFDGLFDSEKAKAAAKALKDYKEILDGFAEGVAPNISKAQMLINVANNDKLGPANQAEAIKQLNRLAPEYLQHLTLQNLKIKEGKDMIDEYIKSLKRRAMEESVEVKRQEKVKERLLLKDRVDLARKTKEAYDSGKLRDETKYTTDGTPPNLGGHIVAHSTKQDAIDYYYSLLKDDKKLLNDIKDYDRELADSLLKYAAIKTKRSTPVKLLTKHDLNKKQPVDVLQAKSLDFAKTIELDKQHYETEKALLDKLLDKKLISQAEYQKQSQQLQEAYHVALGDRIKDFHTNELAGTEDVITKTFNELKKSEAEIRAEDHGDTMAKDKHDVEKAILPGDKLNAEKKLIEDKYSYEINMAGNNAEKIKQLEEQKLQALNELNKKYQEQRKAFELQTAQKVSDTAFGMLKGNIQSQSDAKIKSLETQKQAELNNTSLTSTQKQAINDKYKKKEADEKVKAFKAEQKASILQAVINGALAITKATAQSGMLAPFVIPGIILETAIQVATIAKQKAPQYAKGGLHYQSDGRGALLSGYSRIDDTNAYLRSGEAVVVSEAMRNPWARNLVSAINVAHGGRDFSVSNPGRGYAIGGIFTDGGNANRYYSQPANDVKDLANTLAYQMINNFPPIYVDVKDVNNQQNILAQTVNRVNL